jgi:type IV pilus secretin PilQ/predicted competence protein
MNTKTLTVIIGLFLGATAYGQMPKGQTLSLSLEDVPITTALNMIAAQNGLNLVVAGEVSGRVTLRLENVEVATALDAILVANGYNYFLKDNVIVVKSASSDAAGELESRVVNLKYVSPTTAEKAITALKSARGSVAILDRASAQTGQGGTTPGNAYFANRIVVTDYPGLVDRLVAVVTQIDLPERSIMIEAKIVETTIDAESNLGLSWPTALTGTVSDNKASSASSSTSTLTNAAGTYDPNNGSWTWGKLSVGEVQMILQMLEKNGNSRLVSDPRITTLENHEAVFKFQTIIPIQTINRFTEGSSTSDIVTFQDEEIGISLRVVPRINEGGTLTLEVEPTVEDILAYAGTGDNKKPIKASRTIHTTITVNDGESVALGGLLKETEIENIQRVPILGHIPLIGSWLFSSKSKEKSSTDLLILITPHILE